MLRTVKQKGANHEKSCCFIRFRVDCSPLFPSDGQSHSTPNRSRASWHCIEALYNGQPVSSFDATITFIDAEYFETRFDRESDYGRSKGLCRFSVSADTLYSDLPSDIPRTYGGQSKKVNGKLIYDYSLYCPQDLWESVGQTAIGWGWPTGSQEELVLATMEGDSILHLKSWDQKTLLTYSYGAKRPPHNPGHL